MSDDDSSKPVPKTVVLNNGKEIPTVGLGVYLADVGEETLNAVKTAIDLGYRHIDTARFYENEKEVGK